MIAFLLRRLAIAMGMMFTVTLFLFALLRATPGEPTDVLFDPLTFRGDREAAMMAVREELGLDRSVVIQYFAWLRQLLEGNLGYSYSTHRPVLEMMTDRLGASASLMLVALIIGLVIGIPAGLWSALRRNRFADYMTSAVSLGVSSIPGFFLAMIAIYVFSVTLGWLPSAGINSPDGGLGQRLLHLVMPAGILGLSMAPAYIRWTRSSMLDVLGSDYLVTARAKGIGETRVIARHAVRNALLPLVSIVAMGLPHLLGGAVIMEQIFAWPGMGRLVVDAITSRDYPVILGFTTITALLVVVSSAVADILYAIIDPRIRL